MGHPSVSGAAPRRPEPSIDRTRDGDRHGRARTARATRGEDALDVARRLAPGNAAVQEQLAGYLRARSPEAFDAAGLARGGDIPVPTREELEAYVEETRPAAPRRRPSADPIDRLAEGYAAAIGERVAFTSLTGPRWQPHDAATISRAIADHHRQGGAGAIGDLTRALPSSEGARRAADAVATLRTLSPADATRVAERTADQICDRLRIAGDSPHGRNIHAVVRAGMTREVGEVILSGARHQYAPATPLRADTDAAAWQRQEEPRLRAAAAGNPAMEASLRSRVRETVAMRDWLESLPTTDSALFEHFAAVAREDSGAGLPLQSPGAAARFVQELRESVERHDGDCYRAFMEQAPETRRIVRDRSTLVGL